MIRVGCCGFPTSTKKYFESFDLVELNRTFYHYPQEKTVEGWRKTAPENFEFTVKAHQDISHKARMNFWRVKLVKKKWLIALSLYENCKDLAKIN
jgi:uncharacterized protein YecE (DUF72 family)